MKVSSSWLAATGAKYSAGIGRSGIAHLNHYNAEYCEWGEGPPLIIVPGLAGGYRLLGPLARLLSKRFRVISYHLRGEDDVFALRRKFDLMDMVRDLHEFIQWHYLERPAIFGVSFGGVLAMEYAARYPNCVDKMALQGVGARFERSLLQRVAGMVLTRYPLPTNNPFVNQFFNLLFGGRDHSRSIFRFVVRQCWRTDQSVMAHRFRLVQRFNMAKRLEQILTPTLVLSGDRDLLVSKSSLKCLTNGISNSSLVRLPGAGHLGFVTQPERVAEEVIQFMEPE